MKADALTLGAALNSAEVDYYTIPQYQRPYTWNSENFTLLWDDLLNAYNGYKDEKENGVYNEYYFLGPIVFVLNRVKRSFDIIDGQQRITTFHIILWNLYKTLTDLTEKARLFQILTFLQTNSKLVVSAKDSATFLEIRETNGTIQGNTKMAICANYFHEQISLLSDANEFSEFLREFTQFIVITADDYNKAWDLFIGLNGKGEPLNPTDLIKAYVCGQSSIEDIGVIWDERILLLKEDSTQFLLFLSRYKGKRFIAENMLFKEFARLFSISIREVDISRYSKIFYLFWLKPLEDLEEEFPEGFHLSPESKKNLKIIRDLKRRDITTLIFQFIDSFGEESIFDLDILKLLAAYEIRMSIARKRARENKIVTHFSMNNFNNRRDALNLIKEFVIADAPDDFDFINYVKLADYGNNTARIILRSFEEGIRGNRTITDFQLEHLMPKTSTEFWLIAAEANSEETYLRIVNSIGNLFVIDPTTNNQVKNCEYSIKKNFYQRHLSDWSIARLTADKDDWKTEDIENRTEIIANWAKEYWSIC